MKTKIIITYCAYVSFVANPTVGGALALAVGVGNCIWSSLRYLDIITE